jgi:hypothetical protein
MQPDIMPASITRHSLASDVGFEPTQAGLEAAVLPLHQSGKC